MPKTFTTILWAYQNYGKRQQKIELTKIDQVFEPYELFSTLFCELEKKVPEMQEDVIKRIFQKV